MQAAAAAHKAGALKSSSSVLWRKGRCFTQHMQCTHMQMRKSRLSMPQVKFLHMLPFSAMTVKLPVSSYLAVMSFRSSVRVWCSSFIFFCASLASASFFFPDSGALEALLRLVQAVATHFACCSSQRLRLSSLIRFLSPDGTSSYRCFTPTCHLPKQDSCLNAQQIGSASELTAQCSGSVPALIASDHCSIAQYKRDRYTWLQYSSTACVRLCQIVHGHMLNVWSVQ